MRKLSEALCGSKVPVGTISLSAVSQDEEHKVERQPMVVSQQERRLRI